MFMTLIVFITQFFKKQDTYADLFSSALEEGAKDAFREMGYGHDKEKKDRNHDSALRKLKMTSHLSPDNSIISGKALNRN